MFWRRRKRLSEEIEFHIAAEVEENIGRGMSPEAARHAGLRTFGNIEAAKERARELDPAYWIDTLAQDLRFACRLMVRHRWTTALVIVTLTLAIALNVSSFSLVQALLWRPWLQTDPETFVSLLPRYSGQYRLRYSDSASMSQPDYVFYRDSANSTLSSLAAYRLLTLTLGEPAAGNIRAGLVSCNLFDVIQPGPARLGRYLAPGECGGDGGSTAAVAVLSENEWRNRFQGDPAVVGRVVHVNRVPLTIVGVAPAMAFTGFAGEAGVWIPYSLLGTLRPADEYFADPHAHWLNVVGRRRSVDISYETVARELAALSQHADQRVPGRKTAFTVTDGSLLQDPELKPRVRLLTALVIGSTTLILMLVCMNVTTLLLSRSSIRQREITIRMSLGAGRFRLIRQLLTESLLSSSAATALALCLAEWAPGWVWQVLTRTTAPFSLHPDWSVVAYCVGVAFTVGILAGLSPAIETLNPHPSDSLKSGSSAVTPGRRHAFVRHALVTLQIALGLLLVTQATLFIRAQRRFFSHDPGFETKQVLNVTLASVLSGYQPPAAFYRELETRVAALPGVRTTGFTSLAPWSGRSSTELSEIDGQPLQATHDFRRDPAVRAVSGGYMEALDVALVRGRRFSDHDDGETNQLVKPAIISESMAKRYWPQQDPIGHRFRTGALHEIIGVARDVQSVSYLQDDGPFYYTSLSAREGPYLMVRTSGPVQETAAEIRKVVHGLDPQMAVGVESLDSVLGRQGERLQPAVNFGLLAGLLALLLALTGVYGVVSLSVNQRIHEIGIRLALGAQRRDVVWMVIRSAAGPVGGGLAVGLLLSLAASRGMEAALFGFNPRDPLTLSIVAALILAAALTAVSVPARRASLLDPSHSLRNE